jgi:hypothetical protein
MVCFRIIKIGQYFKLIITKQRHLQVLELESKIFIEFLI